MLEKINADIKDAMKSKQKEKLEALRYLKAMLMENATSKKPIAQMDVIIKHAKKLNDSLQVYPEGEQREKISQELVFVEAYLPQQIEESEVISIIEEIKAAHESPNMGAVMKELSPKIKGRFDGKRASELVKKLL